VQFGQQTELHEVVAPVLATVLLIALTNVGCSRREERARTPITPEYDRTTGRLTLLKFDSNKNGVIDTWSYMDGSRVVRIEIDKDEDGKIDRWEYYGPDQKLQKIGASRRNDGHEDAWSYVGPDGAIDRIEVAGHGGTRITRIERYKGGVLVAVEEDSDGDGRMDKWETYDGARLASVAFDTGHRGTADRRMIYGADGSVRVEADAQGDGHFVVVNK